MEINKIGLFLIDSINKNNNENKNKFMKIIKNFKDNQEIKHNENLEDLSYYLANYENKRNENKSLYDEYIHKRFLLYNQWINRRNNSNLIKLLNFPKLELEEVPEIYTKKRFKNMLK